MDKEKKLNKLNKALERSNKRVRRWKNAENAVGIRLDPINSTDISEKSSKKPTNYIPDVIDDFCYDSVILKTLIQWPLTLCYGVPRVMIYKFISTIKKQCWEQNKRIEEKIKGLEEDQETVNG
jgi:hypothetical protein